MKKKKLILFIIIVGISVFGCNNKEKVKLENETNTTKEVGDTNNQKNDTLKIEQIVEKSLMYSISEIERGIVAIVTEDSQHKIKCSFVDVEKNKLIMTLAEEFFDRNMRVENHSGGIVIYSARGYAYVIGKENYKIESIVDVSEFEEMSEYKTYVVKPSTQEIVACRKDDDNKFQSIVLLDYKGKEKKELLKIYLHENKSEVNEIEDMKLSEDEAHIFVKGEYYEQFIPGEEARVCIGVIGSEDGSFCFEKVELPYFKVNGNVGTYYEGLVKYGEKSNGKCMIMYANGKKKYAKLENNWENQIVYICNKGKRIITYSNDEIGGYESIVNIYEIESNKKIGHTVFENDLYEIFFNENTNEVYGFYYGKSGNTQIEIQKVKQ